jgi:hypothetical protein
VAKSNIFTDAGRGRIESELFRNLDGTFGFHGSFFLFFFFHPLFPRFQSRFRSYFEGIKELQNYFLENLVKVPFLENHPLALHSPERERDFKFFVDQLEPIFRSLVALHVTLTKFKIAILPPSLENADYAEKCDFLLKYIDGDSASLTWPLIFENSAPFNVYQYFRSRLSEEGTEFDGKLNLLEHSLAGLVRNFFCSFLNDTLFVFTSASEFTH